MPRPALDGQLTHLDAVQVMDLVHADCENATDVESTYVLDRFVSHLLAVTR